MPGECQAVSAHHLFVSPFPRDEGPVPRSYLIFSLTALVVTCYTVVALARTFVLWRTRKASGADTSALEERISRLERTVEGLAVDTQRVTDGQRFLTQILADRQSGTEPARVGRG